MAIKIGQIWENNFGARYQIVKINEAENTCEVFYNGELLVNSYKINTMLNGDFKLVSDVEDATPTTKPFTKECLPKTALTADSLDIVLRAVYQTELNISILHRVISAIELIQKHSDELTLKDLIILKNKL